MNDTLLDDDSATEVLTGGLMVMVGLIVAAALLVGAGVGFLLAYVLFA